MGAFQLVDEGIKDIEEPAEPRGEVSGEDQERYIERYNDYQRKLDQCRLGPLTSSRFKRLVGDRTRGIPITVAEIEDRSKGDGLLKLIAILQSLWFITQCIARGVQGLALTQLEVVTLAIVALNVAASAFWWRKPLGVEEPVNVFVPATLYLGYDWEERGITSDDFPLSLVGTLPNEVSLPEEGTRRNEVPPERADVTALHIINGTADKVALAIKFTFDPLRYRRQKPDLSLASSLGLYAIRLPYRIIFVLTYPIFLAFPFAISFLLWTIKMKEQRIRDRNKLAIRLLLALYESPYKLMLPIRKYFGSDDGPLGKISLPEYYRSYQHPSFVLNWFFILPGSFFLLVFLLIILSPLFTVSFIAAFILAVDFGMNPPNIAWHRTTHVPTFYAPHIKRHHHSRVIAFASCCVFSGGIQCITWNSSSPTAYELLAWRLVALVFLSPLLIVLVVIMNNKSQNSVITREVDEITSLSDSKEILEFFYVFIRLSVTALAFTLLRHQPAAAFDAIDWTKYIPHLCYH